MSFTGPGDLAQWLEMAQSAVAIIGLPVLILTMLMIWRQAQYAHHATMSQIYQNTADSFAALQRYFIPAARHSCTPQPTLQAPLSFNPMNGAG
jgi:hypothetical protein